MIADRQHGNLLSEWCRGPQHGLPMGETLAATMVRIERFYTQAVNMSIPGGQTWSRRADRRRAALFIARKRDSETGAGHEGAAARHGRRFPQRRRRRLPMRPG